MAEPNGNPAKEAGQGPPATAGSAAKPSLISRLIKGLQNEEPTSGEGVKTRRRFVAFAVSGFLTTNFLMFLRFFFPRTIFEPKTVFSIGAPTDFGIGVDTKFQKSQRIWVVRNTERIFVISAICTHLGCTPDWKESEQKFKCPCHGSGYDPEGVNYEGPAPRPMDRARVELSPEGQIIVDTSVLFKWEKGKESQFDNPGAFVPV
jgi:cytochrome b6-f complex iron-sulfur subunit